MVEKKRKKRDREVNNHAARYLPFMFLPTFPSLLKSISQMTTKGNKTLWTMWLWRGGGIGVPMLPLNAE